jgi:hypothetical protein
MFLWVVNYSGVFSFSRGSWDLSAAKSRWWMRSFLSIQDCCWRSQGNYRVPAPHQTVNIIVNQWFICCLFNDAETLDHRVVGWIGKSEFQRMWKEAVEEKFEVLYRHFRGDIREKHELCHDNRIFCWNLNPDPWNGDMNYLMLHISCTTVEHTQVDL